MNGAVYLVAGIDTGIGKTYVTGLLAKFLREHQVNAITQKLAQTGCETSSEDIESHRNEEGRALTKYDLRGDTCPYIFRFPASPHLSARMEQRRIDPAVITRATEALREEFEIVLLEGVGGFIVPLQEEYTTADYAAERGYPVILVTSGRLGSINHTLLTLEAIARRKLPLAGVIYNNYPAESGETAKETPEFLRRFLSRSPEFSETPLVEIGPKSDFNVIFRLKNC